jgi:hypothetical protein
MQTRRHTAAGGSVAPRHRVDTPPDHPIDMGTEQAARAESPSMQDLLTLIVDRALITDFLL